MHAKRHVEEEDEALVLHDGVQNDARAAMHAEHGVLHRLDAIYEPAGLERHLAEEGVESIYAWKQGAETERQ